MTTVLFHFGATAALRSRLAPLLEGLDVRWCAEDDEERFAAMLVDTEVLWHVLRPITAADMERAPKLRLIQKLGSGVNTIDLDAARQRGIAVANMPGANAPAVAEATVALMLACLRRLVVLDRRTRAGQGWPIDTELAGSVGELGARTVGLIGYGAIAQRVERVLTALGSRVVHTTSGRDGSDSWRTLDALLAESDIVSLHLPLTGTTQRLIGESQLHRMRPGAILINTSRGGIVDEAALVTSLRTGQLGGAGLDVFAVEPIEAGNPLLELDHVVVQPHVAWLTAETFKRCTAIAAENARRLALGREVAFRVL